MLATALRAPVTGNVGRHRGGIVGYAISWLAVRGKDSAAVTASLGLKASGEKTEYAEAMYTGRPLPSGWFLLVINQAEHKFLNQDSLARLSQGSEVIASTIEEHVMVCASEAWKDGVKVWRIEHDAQESIDHINASGALPDVYASIKSSLSKQQEEAGGKTADTDYFFDIPLQTAKSIVGFKHDEDSGLEDGSFEVFKGSAGSSKPWWKLW
jgi:hypothetical protein